MSTGEEQSVVEAGVGDAVAGAGWLADDQAIGAEPVLVVGPLPGGEGLAEELADESEQVAVGELVWAIVEGPGVHRAVLGHGYRREP